MKQITIIQTYGDHLARITKVRDRWPEPTIQLVERAVKKLYGKNAVFVLERGISDILRGKVYGQVFKPVKDGSSHGLHHGVFAAVTGRLQVKIQSVGGKE